MFQLHSIIALALAEPCCSPGFLQVTFGSATLREFVPYGAGTMLVIMAEILPVGLRYWRAFANQERHPAAPTSDSQAG